MAIQGMFSTVWSRNSSLLSFFHCLEPGWQSVVCFLLFGARIAVYCLSSTVWSMNGNIWSVFCCLEQERQFVLYLLLSDQDWQSVVRLKLLGSGTAICEK